MFAVIISPHNQRVKSAALLRESRARRREGLFLVDGFREVMRAWRSHFEVVEVFLNVGSQASSTPNTDTLMESLLHNSRLPSERVDELSCFAREVNSSGVPVIPLSDSAFAKVSFGDRDEGVVAVVKTKTSNLVDLDAFLEKRRLETGEEILIATLEGVEKPGNFGAILRSADGAGVDALIVSGADYDVFNPSAVRASLGAIFHIPIVVAPPEDVLAWLRKNRIQRVTALCDESVPYSQLDYARPTSIVLGSEARGLTDLWSQETAEDVKYDLLKRARLPMLGVADSLNVSAAAAVFFYEARRFRLGVSSCRHA